MYVYSRSHSKVCLSSSPDCLLTLQIISIIHNDPCPVLTHGWTRDVFVVSVTVCLESRRIHITYTVAKTIHMHRTSSVSVWGLDKVCRIHTQWRKQYTGKRLAQSVPHALRDHHRDVCNRTLDAAWLIGVLMTRCQRWTSGVYGSRKSSQGCTCFQPGRAAAFWQTLSAHLSPADVKIIAVRRA